MSSNFIEINLHCDRLSRTTMLARNPTLFLSSILPALLVLTICSGIVFAKCGYIAGALLGCRDDHELPGIPEIFRDASCLELRATSHRKTKRHLREKGWYRIERRLLADRSVKRKGDLHMYATSRGKIPDVFGVPGNDRMHALSRKCEPLKQLISRDFPRSLAKYSSCVLRSEYFL